MPSFPFASRVAAADTAAPSDNNVVQPLLTPGLVVLRGPMQRSKCLVLDLNDPISVKRASQGNRRARLSAWRQAKKLDRPRAFHEPEAGKKES